MIVNGDGYGSPPVPIMAVVRFDEVVHPGPDRTGHANSAMSGQVDADLALKDVEQKAGQAGDQAQSKWAQAKADAAVKMADIKAKAEQRQSQMDSDIAAADARSAESDANDAIDFANWAVDNARAAILDALDAAAYSVKLAQKAMS
jgi:hypothetical protein